MIQVVWLGVDDAKLGRFGRGRCQTWKTVPRRDEAPRPLQCNAIIQGLCCKEGPSSAAYLQVSSTSTVFCLTLGEGIDSLTGKSYQELP